MSNIRIAIINACTALDDQEIQAAVPALQTQVRRDFAPAWGVDADLVFVPKGQEPPGGCWWLVILDNSDLAGALGYHDLTNEGLPAGKVFAATDKQLNLAWTVTASHELLEMLGDPDINLYSFVQTDFNAGKFYGYEVCDACELDEQGYEIDGILVSDFVYPSWFEGFRQASSATFDQRGLIQRPFELLPGGYAVVFEIPSGLGWYQVDGPQPDDTARMRGRRPGVGSRRERRSTQRPVWRRSGVDIPMRRERAASMRQDEAGSQGRTGIWIPMMKHNVRA
jgi:hypothetical protein